MSKFWKWAFAISALLVASGSATGEPACTGMPGNDPRFCDSGFRWYRVDFVNEMDLKLTTDANPAIAAIAPWTETDIGGPHGNEGTPAISYRSFKPFRGTPSVRFRGSNVNGQGAQWVMWQGKGFKALLEWSGWPPTAESHEFIRPLDLAYYTTVGWENSPAGTSGALLGIMAPGTPLDTNGNLNGSPGTWGFYVDTGGNLRALVADTYATLIDVDTDIDIEPGVEYQLGFTAHISGWGHPGSTIEPCVETGIYGPPPTQSWIRWYVDGNLVLDLPAFGYGPAFGYCIQVTSNMVPGVAHVRLGTPASPPLISRMGYGFSYFE